MSKKSRFKCACLLGFALPAVSAAAADFRISGPYIHENLSVFLIHGSKNGAGGKLLTLEEAMAQKKAVVYETGSVNELSIENLSADEVYIQSGDIVKGGRQDRVLTTDFILPPHSGKLPISVFCVEHGRWSKRGAEAADRFEASSQAVAGKPLKMAVREQKSQTEIWDQVAVAQSGLAAATRGRTAGGVVGGLPSASPTSMQLALESRPVVEATEAYVRALSRVVDGTSDLVGYAYAINGKLDSAEVYGSGELFRRMWPKLLKASAVEAVAARSGGQAAARADAASVERALAEAERGRESSSRAAGRVKVARKESANAVLFEARDGSGGWIHKSYVVK